MSSIAYPRSATLGICVFFFMCACRANPRLPRTQKIESTKVSAPSACALRILDIYRPLGGQAPTKKPGALAPHFGVDFAACEGQPIISVGDGLVIGISTDRESGHPETNGGSIEIMHDVPGTINQVRMYTYLHLKNIRVVPRQRVSRGEPLADPWLLENGGWVPHVHLEVLDSLLPIADRDPLRYVNVCRSNAGDTLGLIFPIPC